MRKYETPKIEVERYDLSNSIMDGYIDGDYTETFPWGDLFKPSGEDANSLLD